MAAKGQAVYLHKQPSPVEVKRWLNWVVPAVLFLGLLIWAAKHLSDPATLPINKIRVHGTFVNLNENMLHQAIDNIVAGGYFNVNVTEVRQVIEELPWVNQATVRRVWPNTLSVTVIEQKAVARWAAGGLLNEQGDLFQPTEAKYVAGLPMFNGPAQLNKIMLKKFEQINALVVPLQSEITHFTMDARHAITLQLANEIEVVLGRENVLERLQRLTKIYPGALAKRSVEIKSIDLRYTNGMAVRWKKLS